MHEGVTWFAHKGSTPLRFTVNITRNSTTGEPPGTAMMKEYPIPQYPEDVLPRPPAAGLKPLSEANFPMDGVPRDQVMEIIHAHGGRLAYLEEDRRAGPEWVSYRYFVVGRSPIVTD